MADLGIRRASRRVPMQCAGSRTCGGHAKTWVEFAQVAVQSPSQPVPQCSCFLSLSLQCLAGLPKNLLKRARREGREGIFGMLLFQNRCLSLLSVHLDILCPKVAHVFE